eukprot:g52064.t1
MRTPKYSPTRFRSLCTRSFPCPISVFLVPCLTGTLPTLAVTRRTHAPKSTMSLPSGTFHSVPSALRATHRSTARAVPQPPNRGHQEDIKGSGEDIKAVMAQQRRYQGSIGAAEATSTRQWGSRAVGQKREPYFPFSFSTAPFNSTRNLKVNIIRMIHTINSWQDDDCRDSIDYAVGIKGDDTYNLQEPASGAQGGEKSKMEAEDETMRSSWQMEEDRKETRGRP